MASKITELGGLEWICNYVLIA